jgi:hypothetical protein
VACAGDLNGDEGYDVLDIVKLANCVLNEDCDCVLNGMDCGDTFGRIDTGAVNDASESKLLKKDNSMYIEANGFIGGVQMTLTHGDDFTIDMTDRALFSDRVTSGHSTRLLIVSPETDELFSFDGNFEISEIIVANSQTSVSVELPLAVSFRLKEAYPNPFNPTTTIELYMPVSGDIKVEVYNLLGQSIATLSNGYKDAGTYNLTWNAGNASSGMYFVKAQAEGFTQIQKLMLVK